MERRCLGLCDHEARSLTSTPANGARERLLPPFAALKAFDAVGRLGGFRKAAGALNLDPAVVSRHVKSLEALVGVALVERGRAGVTLTAAGAAYHARISAALAEIADVTSQLADREGENDLTIWCVPGFAFQWLTGQVSAFRASHPWIRLELRPTDEPADLLAHQADADVRFYGDTWNSLAEHRGVSSLELARPPILVVAAPGMAAKLGQLSSPAALLDAPLLHEEHEEQWRAWFEAHGVTIGQRLPGTRMWHAHLALAAAARGEGVAIANRFLVGDELASGSLVEIAPAGFKPPVLGGYVFTARADRWNAPDLASFRRWLQICAAPPERT